MYNKVAEVVYGSYITLTQFCPDVNMWHYSSTFAKTKKPTLVHYYILDFIWMSPVSPLMSFTCSRIPSRIPCCIQLLCLLSFFCSGTVSQSFLIFHNLDSFVEYWSGILQNVPPFAFIWCFLMIKLELWILEKNTSWVKCPSHHIISPGTRSQHDLLLAMLTWIIWLR